MPSDWCGRSWLYSARQASTAAWARATPLRAPCGRGRPSLTRTFASGSAAIPASGPCSGECASCAEACTGDGRTPRSVLPGAAAALWGDRGTGRTGSHPGNCCRASCSPRFRRCGRVRALGDPDAVGLALERAGGHHRGQVHGGGGVAEQAARHQDHRQQALPVGGTSAARRTAACAPGRGPSGPRSARRTPRWSVRRPRWHPRAPLPVRHAARRSPPLPHHGRGECSGQAGDS